MRPKPRCKLFVLDEMVLLTLLRHLTVAGVEGAPKPPQPFGYYLPCVRGDIPPDAEITGVHYDFNRGAFLVRVEHDSWPEVEHGQMIPVVSERFVFSFHLDERYRLVDP